MPPTRYSPAIFVRFFESLNLPEHPHDWPTQTSLYRRFLNANPTHSPSPSAFRHALMSWHSNRFSSSPSPSPPSPSPSPVAAPPSSSPADLSSPLHTLASNIRDMTAAITLLIEVLNKDSSSADRPSA